MGFYLHGLLVLSERAVALYDRVLPGAGVRALPTQGPGLPRGFFLPIPWSLGGLIMEAQGWFSEAEASLWRERLALPIADDPEEAYDLADCRLAAFVSLASPSGALLLTLESAGDGLECEYAAAFQGGLLRAAAGASYLDERSYLLEEGAYRTLRGELTPRPTERCAALLDPRLTSAAVYKGYLPQKTEEGVLRPRSGRVDWGDVPPLEQPPDPAWEAWFPVLKGLPRR